MNLSVFNVFSISIMSVKVNIVGSGIRLRTGGIDMISHVREPRVAELASLMPVKLPPVSSKFLLCPMSGIINAIFVSDGDKVEASQPLAIVEAMKMENTLRAEKKQRFTRVGAKVGASLTVDEIIREFE